MLDTCVDPISMLDDIAVTQLQNNVRMYAYIMLYIYIHIYIYIYSGGSVDRTLARRNIVDVLTYMSPQG